MTILNPENHRFTLPTDSCRRGSIDSRCRATLKLILTIKFDGSFDYALSHWIVWIYFITILFTIYLTFGIGMAKFLGFQNRGFVREKFTTNLCFWAKLWRISIPLSLAPCPLPLHAPCPSLSHLNTFRAGRHGTPCQTERSRDSLSRGACPECWLKIWKTGSFTPPPPLPPRKREILPPANFQKVKFLVIFWRKDRARISYFRNGRIYPKIAPYYRPIFQLF